MANVMSLLYLYKEELRIHGVDGVQDERGTTMEHCLWMIETLQFADPSIRHQEKKEQRWIGYIQCLLNVHGVYTLEQLKQHSRDYLV